MGCNNEKGYKYFRKCSFNYSRLSPSSQRRKRLGYLTEERTQKHIRLVGLSATLPNYYDVADFLKVDRKNGLFHFDANYRPVPLLIHFIGIKNPKDSTNNLSKKRNVRDIFNERCYEMAFDYLKQNKQVLIFVHSRR